MENLDVLCNILASEQDLWVGWSGLGPIQVPKSEDERALSHLQSGPIIKTTKTKGQPDSYVLWTPVHAINPMAA